MTKVAYNNCYGGFGLSHEATVRYAEIKGIKIYGFVDARDGDFKKARSMRPYDPQKDIDAFLVHYCTTPEYSNDAYWRDNDIDRADPALIQVIEEMREKANGRCASLQIEDVPSGASYRIDEYDGNERVMTRDDYDWKTA